MNLRSIKFFTPCLSAALAFFFACQSPNEEVELRVFAGAGLTTTMEEMAESYRSLTGEKISFNFASSGMLAKQIISGAPADVYISANRYWMEEVERSAKLARGTVTEVARNTLVVIVSPELSRPPSSLSDLGKPEIETIALGDPSHVPAGTYARQALINAGIWRTIKDKILPALNVRAVVAYVERGEAEAGIVYRSDAVISDKVLTAFVVPSDLHEPITFLGAVVKTGNIERAGRFLDFIKGQRGAEIFKRNGFDSPKGH